MESLVNNTPRCLSCSCRPFRAVTRLSYYQGLINVCVQLGFNLGFVLSQSFLTGISSRGLIGSSIQQFFPLVRLRQISIRLNMPHCLVLNKRYLCRGTCVPPYVSNEPPIVMQLLFSLLTIISISSFPLKILCLSTMSIRSV